MPRIEICLWIGLKERPILPRFSVFNENAQTYLNYFVKSTYALSSRNGSIFHTALPMSHAHLTFD